MKAFALTVAGLIKALTVIALPKRHLFDLGPGAGHDGGRLVFEGTPADLVESRSTLTGEHLAAFVGGAKAVPRKKR